MTPLITPRRQIFVLVVVLLCSAFIPPAGATGQPSTPSTVAEHGPVTQLSVTGVLYQQQNNTTVVQHENPDSTNRDGNLNGVESHLSRVLAERLGQSTVQLSQGEYQQARQLVGDQYSDSLEKYVDVAGDTGNEGTAEQFSEARDAQQEYTNTVQEFRQTGEEYREAKQNGNEERARELARELTQLAQQSNREARRVNNAYTSLSNRTGADFTDSRESLDEIQQNISTEEQSVVSEEFTKTELTITTTQSHISFRNPLKVQGMLVSENGSALSNQAIALQTSVRTVTTTTDENGQFTLSYRPALLPLATENLTLRYLPNQASIYLGSSETVDVSVTRTNATLRLTDAPSSTAYGSELNIAGELVVDNSSVQSVPVTVSLGETPLGTAQTNENGQYSLQIALPARASAGAQELSVQVGVRDRAVTATPAVRSVTVKQTSTALTLSANDGSSQSVTVSGEFQTTEGQAIDGQEVRLLVNGTRVGTATTGPGGTYQTQIQIPESALSGETSEVMLTAVYAGRGTNLESARATETVVVSESDSSSSAGSTLSIVGVFVLLVATFGGGLFYYRRSGVNDAAPTSPTNSEAMDSRGEPTREIGQSLLDLARDRLASGETEAATTAAYEALRQRFATDIGLHSSATHWEFYREYQTHVGSQASKLRTLIEQYEKAAYSPIELSEDEANEAIDISTRLVDAQRPPSDDG